MVRRSVTSRMEGDAKDSKDASEPTYADHTRFELELEVDLDPNPQCCAYIDRKQFVQCLSNPFYLHELSTKGLFGQPEFINYLEYLQYFKEPEYAKYLYYPGTTLRILELIQQKRFRDRLGDPGFAEQLAMDFAHVASEGRPS